MEDLTESFKVLNMDAQNELEHPILTDGDPCEVSLTLRPEAEASKTPEDICHTRWPGFTRHEKHRMELRLGVGKYVEWTEAMKNLDGLMNIWQDDKRPTWCQTKTFIPFYRQPSKRKQAENFDTSNVISLAINPHFALVMTRTQQQQSWRNGDLWALPVCNIENVEKAKWIRVPVEKVVQYQASYLLDGILYLVAGKELRLVNLDYASTTPASAAAMFTIELYAMFQLPPEVEIFSFRVNYAGFFMMQMAGGVICLGQISIPRRQCAPLKTFKCEATTLDNQSCQYTCFSITPSHLANNQILLGRSDGLIERWALYQDLQQGGRITLKADGLLDLFKNHHSHTTGRNIEVVSGVPVLGLYNRGRRIIAYTKFNRAVIEDTPKVPQFFFQENPTTRIVDIDICGDLMATLQDNGAMRIGPFIATSSTQVMTHEAFLLGPAELMAPGQQRIVAFPDMVATLTKNGRLIVMNLHEAKLN